MTSEERRKARRERRTLLRNEKRKDTYSIYNNFDLITDPDNLYQAFKKSRKSVSWKESVQRYILNLFRNIVETRYKLLNGDSVFKGFVEFDLLERGKLRHIKSIHISEKVIQRCLCDNILVPIISRTLIYDNGASLKGKGLHFSIRRFKRHLSCFYRKNNYSNKGYCLSIDFSKFFDRVRHDLLLIMLKEIIQEPKIIKITHGFIAPFGDGISLGLGSQVSQILALLYPSRIDHYIKEMLRITYYGRYMDDLYLIHENREYLLYCLDKIKEQCAKLGIIINIKKTRITKLEDGIKFLKGVYFLTEKGRIICRATQDSRKRMRRRLVKFKRLLIAGKMSITDIRAAYQSWRGNYLKRFNAYHTIRRMDITYNNLFIFDREN